MRQNINNVNIRLNSYRTIDNLLPSSILNLNKNILFTKKLPDIQEHYPIYILMKFLLLEVRTNDEQRQLFYCQSSVFNKKN